jgi:hypothetical protein
VAIEKNLDAFLSLDLPGSKVVVGDGPARKKLQTRFPGAHFVGEMRDERLAAAYASADVFVFPSLTDTFGLVLLEALASGLPVAANPVVGPLDVIGDSGAGVLDANLGRAALAALSIPRELARARALTFSLSESARQFVDNVFAAHWAAALGIMSRAPFETMNLTSSSSEIEGSGAQIEALRELGGNDRTRKKTSSNFEETERGRKGDKPCPGCAKNGGC